MKYVLVTGGSGFLGGLLLEQLLTEGHHCISLDVRPQIITHPGLVSIEVDIRNKKQLEDIFKQYPIESILHCAAMLAHGHINPACLWESNVDGTRHLVDLAIAFGVPRFVFTSSNCLWGSNLHRLVKEDDEPGPVEIYGKSKLAAEKILLAQQDKINIIIFRCPTIIDAGRMGLLSILFEFIHEGRKIYVVGGGKNRYQFIYAKDLINALIKSLKHERSDVFNIGSDNVKPLVEVFNYVIHKANTGAKTSSLPKTLTLAAMKIAYKLRLSPLGPYHYKMIAEDFVFDTGKVKAALSWKPSLTNEEMLWKGYEYYVTQLDVEKQYVNVSAHKKPASMGIIRLLKWLS